MTIIENLLHVHTWLTFLIFILKTKLYLHNQFNAFATQSANILISARSRNIHRHKLGLQKKFSELITLKIFRMLHLIDWLINLTPVTIPSNKQRFLSNSSRFNKPYIDKKKGCHTLNTYRFSWKCRIRFHFG